MGKTKGNVNRLAALWLAVTTGQNWNNDDTFTWDRGFITTIPKDMNPLVPDTFKQVMDVVEAAHPHFSTVITTWNNLAGQLLYAHPDTQPGIMALANTKPKKGSR